MKVREIYTKSQVFSGLFRSVFCAICTRTGVLDIVKRGLLPLTNAEKHVNTCFQRGGSDRSDSKNALGTPRGRTSVRFSLQARRARTGAQERAGRAQGHRSAQGAHRGTGARRAQGHRSAQGAHRGTGARRARTGAQERAGRAQGTGARRARTGAQERAGRAGDRTRT